MSTDSTSTHARKLLYIEASPRGDRSQSRKLGQKFLAAWKTAHPGAVVAVRDVGSEPPPFVTSAWVEGAFTPAEQHSPAAREAIAVSDRYVDELLAADEVVISTPMYNLSVPAALKAWIDQIVRFGRTFTRNAAGGYDGLAGGGKRVVVIVTSGGDYRLGTPGGAYNHLEPYLRTVLGFIGITSVEFVYAHSQSGEETVAHGAAESAQELLTQLVAA